MNRDFSYAPCSIAAACSAAMFSLILIAWFAASSINPRDQFISLGHGFHITLDTFRHDARLEFFNDANYGPYRGSIISVAPSPWPHARRFGDFAGIYYRYFLWPDNSSLWTLSLSLLYPLILFAALPTACLIRFIRHIRVYPRHQRFNLFSGNTAKLSHAEPQPTGQVE